MQRPGLGVVGQHGQVGRARCMQQHTGAGACGSHPGNLAVGDGEPDDGGGGDGLSAADAVHTVTTPLEDRCDGAAEATGANDGKLQSRGREHGISRGR